jgi:surface protein
MLNPDGAISINASTGEVTVNDPALFDFEMNTSINATYVATAGMITSTANITIEITDVDESTGDNGFVTTWRTTEANESVIIPVIDTLNYNYEVDWGDGSSNAGITENAEHSYASSGVYTLTITGEFPAIHFEQFGFDPFVGIPEQKQLASIEQWGDIEWQTMTGAFYGCENLVYNASDLPNLSTVSDLSKMFYNAKDFNGAIGDWDVSIITNMESMFLGADSFNQPLNNWDVSNVTNMSFLFFSANVFDQPLDKWDVSKVTTMKSMFLGTAFNQPIGNWEVGNVTNMEAMFAANDAFNQPLENWNVGKVTNMVGMFRDTEVFNQPLAQWDASNVIDMRELFSNAKVFNQSLDTWDVSNVENMNRMFVQAAAFNGAINDWDVSQVEDMAEMFNEASTFNQDLSGWNVDAVENCAGFLTSSGLEESNRPNFTNCSI